MGSKLSKKKLEKNETANQNPPANPKQPNQPMFPHNNKPTENVGGFKKPHIEGSSKSKQLKQTQLAEKNNYHINPHQEDITEIDVEPVVHSRYLPPPNVHPVTLFELNEENMRMYQPRCCGSTSMRSYGPVQNFGKN